MTSAAEIQARYERDLANFERVTLRRYTGTGNARTYQDSGECRARLMTYKADPLGGGLIQGSRRMIVLASDVAAASWPAPPRKNDKVVINGAEAFNVEAVDDQTRRYQGQLIAYEIEVKG